MTVPLPQNKYQIIQQHLAMQQAAQQPMAMQGVSLQPQQYQGYLNSLMGQSQASTVIAAGAGYTNQLMLIYHPQEINYDGADWKAEEEICFDPVDGTCAVAARAERALRQVANASRVAAYIGASLCAAFKPPIENAGIRIGEIEAFRCWNVLCGKLQSVAHQTIWPDDWKIEADNLPEEDNWHGIYAYKTEQDAIAHGGMVAGKVKLWGQIIEHEEGYRAQYAKVVSIDHFLHGTSRDCLRVREPERQPIIANSGNWTGYGLCNDGSLYQVDP
jgi:hypothetical protein